MDLISIIGAAVAAVGGVSGLVAMFTIRETKKGMALDNKEKEDNRWSKLCDELQDQIETLNERLTNKDARITELEDSNAALRSQLDSANTELAKALILKCSRISCSSRRPPLGYTELTPEELAFEKSRVGEE